MTCGVGHRRSLDPELLWLCHRAEATALIRPLAWEPPYADAAIKRQKKKKKKKKNHLGYRFKNENSELNPERF